MILSVLCLILAGQPIHQMDADALDAYSRAQLGAFEDRLAKVVRDTVGTEYADGPLGEGPEGVYDQDPLVDFSRADCVTYVEQSIALATGENYDDMFATLQKIRYRGGAIDYESRNHFLISDWIENNAFCTEVTSDLGVSTQTLTRTISRREFFDLVKAPDLGEHTRDREVTLSIVPSTDVEQIEDTLPSPSLIVFVGNVDWLFALHCGMYVRDETGQGLLYHASSKAAQVVGVDLGDYVAEQGNRYRGLSAYQIHDPDTIPTRP